MKNVLLEALLVAVIGGIVAFGANAFSPRGLKLTRNFFGTGSPVVATITNLAGATAKGSSLEAQVVARLESKGLQLASQEQVVSLYRDPRREQSLILFVDARDDAHYQQGHIPGAYQLDYYHPEAYLGALLPLCQLAEKIVVYCKGGECEDSEFAATFLSSAGIPKDKLLVYGGGITQWMAEGLPIEIGNRLSGQIQTNRISGTSP